MLSSSFAYTIAMMILAAAPIVTFWHFNKDDMRVERYYYRNNATLFQTLQFALFFLMLVFAIYSRVLIMDILEATKILDYMKNYVAQNK